MANTYHQIHLQIVFAVKFRRALLEKEWRSTVFGVVGNLINETGCKTLIVNGVQDHIHCLVGLKPAVAVSELMKTVKAKSSKYINENRLTSTRFEWQEGYGVFSYSPAQVDQVYKYIMDQESHHQKTAFQDEYRKLLDEFGISYDKDYLFREPE